jgi:hypothetical protein
VKVGDEQRQYLFIYLFISNFHVKEIIFERNQALYNLFQVQDILWVLRTKKGWFGWSGVRDDNNCNLKYFLFKNILK